MDIKPNDALRMIHNRMGKHTFKKLTTILDTADIEVCECGCFVWQYLDEEDKEPLMGCASKLYEEKPELYKAIKHHLEYMLNNIKEEAAFWGDCCDLDEDESEDEEMIRMGLKKLIERKTRYERKGKIKTKKAAHKIK